MKILIIKLYCCPKSKRQSHARSFNYKPDENRHHSLENRCGIFYVLHIKINNFYSNMSNFCSALTVPERFIHLHCTRNVFGYDILCQTSYLLRCYNYAVLISCNNDLHIIWQYIHNMSQVLCDFMQKMN